MAKLQIVQETEGEWTGPTYALIHGVRIATFVVNPNLEEELKLYQTRHDDVFVTSFPKSGTTMMREILWQIFHDGVTSDVHLASRVYFLEKHPLVRRSEADQSDSKPVIELLPSPRLFVSHLPYHVIPKGRDKATECKYIYIARNPKDVAVSYYHFMKHLPGMNDSNMTLEMFLNKFLEGKFAYNLWSDHVLGWWKHREDPNVLFLKYEDMLKDLPANVRAMAKFVNKPLSEEIVQRIAHQCSFDEMAKNPASFQVFPGNKDVSFLRKGKVGDWKKHFTPEMNQKYETEFITKMRENGLEFE